MKRAIVGSALLAALAASFLYSPTRADKPPAKRVPWTASKVKGSPEPPPPYKLEPAFPKLKFFEPLELASAPGTGRLLVATRPGKVWSFANDPKAEKADLLLDLKKVAYGLVPHPKFAENGWFYVTYIVDPSKETPTGTRVSRFTAKGGAADPKSEKVIIEWPNGGHNGGCLRFGPDGMLYIATGDGSGIADGLETGQDISDLLGSILRIDVNGAPEGKGYAIPDDNPFVKTKGARGEVWAYGLRQPWKYSFDRKTGELWAGEVGQDLWEMVLRIRKGGNYGWSVTEGKHPFRPERKKGPTPILEPVVEHPHSDFRSITGGYVYRGKRLPDLAGHYVYGDYDTGRVWSFRMDKGKVTRHRELLSANIRLVAWAEDEAGELLLVDWVGGQVHRLAKAPPRTKTHKFPRKLSETGLFASTKGHVPAAGLLPYEVNSQLWSDGAAKERFLAIPGEGKIQFDAIEYPQPSPGAPRGWKFPDGTVAVKTFSVETDKGKRRLETRLLHFQQLEGSEEVGDQYWRGYTYAWNDEQTDAELLDSKGLDKVYTDKAGKKRTWHFPSRAECVLCHTMPAKYVLGLNTHQLNRDRAGENQLAAWETLGLFTKPLPTTPDKLPRMASPDDPKADTVAKARSYLHANCAHCHMKWGGGNAAFQLMYTLAPADMGVIGVKPAHGDLGVKGGLLVKPGHPELSLVHHRMAKLGLGRMPHVASNVVDEAGVKLVEEWIKGLPAR
ncbi:MAG: PQQ-dependent sugar dehydrogenase [Gemmataceae bacterium]|nr:PQQ-dependent sugar dehydrogenase [Gemmataceae bacterium]